jgi:hypothetical protein
MSALALVQVGDALGQEADNEGSQHHQRASENSQEGDVACRDRGDGGPGQYLDQDPGDEEHGGGEDGRTHQMASTHGLAPDIYYISVF